MSFKYVRYEKYSQNKGWKFEVLDVSESDLKGYKVSFFSFSLFKKESLFQTYPWLGFPSFRCSDISYYVVYFLSSCFALSHCPLKSLCLLRKQVLRFPVQMLMENWNLRVEFIECRFLSFLIFLHLDFFCSHIICVYAPSVASSGDWEIGTSPHQCSVCCYSSTGRSGPAQLISCSMTANDWRTEKRNNNDSRSSFGFFDSLKLTSSGFKGLRLVIWSCKFLQVDVQLRNEDLKIDTYRSGGSGGQSVNTTNSAVRVTHVPTGLTVAIQDERSQHQARKSGFGIAKILPYCRRLT